jgi:hypothetical protein
MIRDEKSRVPIPGGEKIYVPTGCRAQSVSYSMETGGYSLRWSDRDVLLDHLPQSSAEVKDEWSCTSTPLICLRANFHSELRWSLPHRMNRVNLLLLLLLLLCSHPRPDILSGLSYLRCVRTSKPSHACHTNSPSPVLPGRKFSPDFSRFPVICAKFSTWHYLHQHLTNCLTSSVFLTSPPCLLISFMCAVYPVHL